MAVKVITPPLGESRRLKYEDICNKPGIYRYSGGTSLIVVMPSHFNDIHIVLGMTNEKEFFYTTEEIVRTGYTFWKADVKIEISND